jgi:CrcB protein
LIKLVVIGLGGALGAILRYSICDWAARRFEGEFPYGTLIVNVLGCLILGGLMAYIGGRADVSPRLRLFVTIGILSSLTTFSAFGYETVELVSKNEFKLALGSVVANLVLGCLAVVIARTTVKAVFG